VEKYSGPTTRTFATGRSISATCGWAEKVDAGGRHPNRSGRIVFHGDGADSGNGADACKQLLEKCMHSFVRAVLGLRKETLKVKSERYQKPGWTPTRRTKLRISKTGAGEKDEREAQLRDDEGAPCEAAAFAGGRTAAASLSVWRLRMRGYIGREESRRAKPAKVAATAKARSAGRSERTGGREDYAARG